MGEVDLDAAIRAKLEGFMEAAEDNDRRPPWLAPDATIHFRIAATPSDWIGPEHPRGRIIGDCYCGFSYSVPAGSDEFGTLEDAQGVHERVVARELGVTP